LQGPELINLLVAVDELNIQTLVNCVQKYLINDKEFMQENFMEILQMVYHNELFVDLLDYCLGKIEILYNSDNIISLEAPLLEFLLKRDDLNLDEIEIWDGLIKWGLAQEQVINQDVSKWDKDSFNIFRRILHNFIPLIRFYEISSDDYISKVKPYEEILSKELRDNILKYHLNPEYKPMYTSWRNVDSIVINRKHTALIANWIDKNDIDHGKIPYKFNLLYRASRDGNTAATFHDKCDNKGATIVVLKIINSERIVGGYNPLFWDKSNSSKSTRDSFMFSFSDKNNLQSANVVYSKGYAYSIKCFSCCGPIFGCSDLYINYINSDRWSSNCTNCYPTLSLPSIMNVVDYEVFQVIKK
jgi:hypothetical protein